MFGDEANPHRALLNIEYPIAEGRVTNWDKYEQLWEYIFSKKLNLPMDNLKEHNILITEAAMNPTQNREKMAQILFEKFGFGGIYFESQALLSLMAEGTNTGFVFDSGDGVSHVIPVVEGNVIPHAIRRTNVAGRHVTTYLNKLLNMRGYAFNSTADFEVVREIKEDLCYVSYDIKKERKLAKETTFVDKDYTLPSGEVIRVGRERFEAAEVLFNPMLNGQSEMGIARMVRESLAVCDIDIVLPLMQNIMITGGTTMFAGLAGRLYSEIVEELVEHRYKGNRAPIKDTGLTVLDPPRRKHAVFIGGSFLAGHLPKEQWITSEEYGREGRNALFMH
jgi:actin-related protein 2